MAVVTIKPQTAGALVTLNSVEYRQFISYADFTVNAPIMEETVFSTENLGGESSVGTEIGDLGLRGIMRRGATGAGPLMPLSSFQNMPFVLAWDTGCQVSGTCSLYQAGAYRAAGATGTIDGRARVSGAYIKSWNVTS
jgi:hypothetical protein